MGGAADRATVERPDPTSLVGAVGESQPAQGHRWLGNTSGSRGISCATAPRRPPPKGAYAICATGRL